MALTFDGAILTYLGLSDYPKITREIERIFSGESVEVTLILVATLKISVLDREREFTEEADKLRFSYIPSDLYPGFTLQYVRLVDGMERDNGALHFIGEGPKGGWYFCFPALQVYAPGEEDVHLLELVLVRSE